MLCLPSTEGSLPSLEVNSETGYKLEDLGPLIINADGTMSRINNWKDLSDIEKSRFKRVIERNERRRQKLNEEA